MQININFHINRKAKKNILYSLIGTEIFLVILSLINTLCELDIDFINLNQEANIPTWFSTMQLLATGLLCLVISFKNSFKEYSLFLKVFGACILFISADETAQIHERISNILGNLPQILGLDFVRGDWIFFYLAILLGLIIYLRNEIKLFLVNHKHSASLFLSGIILYILGAAFVEILCYESPLQYQNPLAYEISAVVEEFLEMLGVTIIFYSLLTLENNPS